MVQRLSYIEAEQAAIELLRVISQHEEGEFIDATGNPVDLNQVKEQLLASRRSLVRCLDDSVDS
jgi:hypothetical protein